MKNIKWVVIGMTVYLFIYAATPSLGLVYDLILFLFVVGNFGLIYMVYAVLKYGEQPDRKFSDGYWYSDVDKKYSED